MLKVTFYNNNNCVCDVEVEKGTQIINAITSINDLVKEDVYAVIINNRLHSIFHEVRVNSKCELITYQTEMGKKMYESTLKYVFLMASRELYPNISLKNRNKLGRDIVFKVANTSLDLKLIKNKMNEVIVNNLPIEKKRIRFEELQEIYEQKMEECSIPYLNAFEDDFTMYFCNSYTNYLYNRLISNTGAIKEFDLQYIGNNILIRMPDENDSCHISTDIANERIFELFNETESIQEFHGITDLASMNRMIINKNESQLINLAESIHQFRFIECSSKIVEGNYKIIFIAGPSSSGKTTSAKRIQKYLSIKGHSSFIIEMDNFFLDDAHSPVDEFGKKDYDSINHLDINLFQKIVQDLQNGMPVKLPKYDFTLNGGMKVYKDEPINLEKETVLIVEGIHALNPIITENFNKNDIFKIYVAPMATLNYDAYTKVSSNDVRLIRRIVRDYLIRGSSASLTLERWDNVRKGEKRNIFPYMSTADICINTSLLYEMCILGPIASNILEEVLQTDTNHYKAKELYKMLRRFKSISNTDLVPSDSIFREFIGGSCFY